VQSAVISTITAGSPEAAAGIARARDEIAGSTLSWTGAIGLALLLAGVVYLGRKEVRRAEPLY
jgi:hypothetical protein